MQIGPAVWYEALATELGVIIKCDDPQGTRMKLYQIRKELHDPDLDQISVMQSPNDPGGELWLVKRNGHATKGSLSPGEGDPQSS